MQTGTLHNSDGAILDEFSCGYTSSLSQGVGQQSYGINPIEYKSTYFTSMHFRLRRVQILDTNIDVVIMLDCSAGGSPTVVRDKADIIQMLFVSFCIMVY